MALVVTVVNNKITFKFRIRLFKGAWPKSAKLIDTSMVPPGCEDIAIQRLREALPEARRSHPERARAMWMLSEALKRRRDGKRLLGVGVCGKITKARTDNHSSGPCPSCNRIRTRVYDRARAKLKRKQALAKAKG